MEKITNKKKARDTNPNCIDYPGVMDVLCGRGGHASTHPGNVNFRMLAEKYKQRYSEASRFGKSQVAAEVVDVWRRKGGRFLTKTAENLWIEIQFKLAVKKASQCLRMPRQSYGAGGVLGSSMPLATNLASDATSHVASNTALRQQQPLLQQHQSMYAIPSMVHNSFNSLFHSSTINSGGINPAAVASAALVAAASISSAGSSMHSNSIASVVQSGASIIPSPSSQMVTMNNPSTKPVAFQGHERVEQHAEARNQPQQPISNTVINTAKTSHAGSELDSVKLLGQLSKDKFPIPSLPSKKRKHAFDDYDVYDDKNVGRLGIHRHRRHARHQAKKPATTTHQSTGEDGESEAHSSKSSSSSSRGDSDQESKESSRGDSDDFESSKDSSTGRDTGSSDQGQSSGSSDQGQNSDQDTGDCETVTTQRKRSKKANGAQASAGSYQKSRRSDGTTSDVTKNVFDDGPTNGSSDDSAMERIMNKSIESFSDTSSESNAMKSSRKKKLGCHAHQGSRPHSVGNQKL